MQVHQFATAHAVRNEDGVVRTFYLIQKNDGFCIQNDECEGDEQPGPVYG